MIRDDEIIADGLTVSNLKHHKKTVSVIEKGQECGVSFNSARGVKIDWQRGDLLECYQEVDAEETKFDKTPGLVKTF